MYLVKVENVDFSQNENDTLSGKEGVFYNGSGSLTAFISLYMRLKCGPFGNDGVSITVL
jgi:hypothetical protein